MLQYSCTQLQSCLFYVQWFLLVQGLAYAVKKMRTEDNQQTCLSEAIFLKRRWTMRRRWVKGAVCQNSNFSPLARLGFYDVVCKHIIILLVVLFQIISSLFKIRDQIRDLARGSHGASPFKEKNILLFNPKWNLRIFFITK